MAAIIAAMAAGRQRLIKQLISRGAINEDGAIPANEISTAALGARRELERQGVIKTDSGGRIYLDQVRLQEIYRGNRAALKIVLPLLSAVAAVLGLLAYLSHAA